MNHKTLRLYHYSYRIILDFKVGILKLSYKTKQNKTNIENQIIN